MQCVTMVQRKYKGNGITRIYPKDNSLFGRAPACPISSKDSTRLLRLDLNMLVLFASWPLPERCLRPAVLVTITLHKICLDVKAATTLAAPSCIRSFRFERFAPDWQSVDAMLRRSAGPRVGELIELEGSD